MRVLFLSSAFVAALTAQPPVASTITAVPLSSVTLLDGFQRYDPQGEMMKKGAMTKK